MDASTPQNPNKPRLSRRLLSHFTLTISVLLALSFVTLAVVGPATDTVNADPILDQIDWFDPWTYTFLDEIYSFLSNQINGNQAITSGEALKSYREITADHYESLLELAKSTVINEIELGGLAANFYARRAEMAALGYYQFLEENDLPMVYNQTAIFDYGDIYHLLLNQFEMAMTSYKSIFGTLHSYQTRFSGDYQSMTLYPVASGTTGPAGNSANPSEYIITNNLESDGKYYFKNDSKLYFFSYNSVSTARNYSFYDAAGNFLGYYNHVDTYPNKQIISIDLVEIVGGNALVNGEGVIKIVGSGGDKVAILGDGIPTTTGTDDGKGGPSIIAYEPLSNKWTSACLRINQYNYYRVAFNDRSTPLNNVGNFDLIVSGNGTSTLALKDDLLACQQAFDTVKSLMTVANNYAQSYFNYLVVNGDDGIPFVPPSVIFIDPEQMADMTLAEIYSIYIAYMLALEQGFEDGYTVSPGNITLSLDSLQLVCRGSIKNSTGHQIVDNQTIFTPFVSVADMILTLGNNTMTQAGFAMQWGNCSSLGASFTDPSNESFTPATMLYIPLGVNYTLHIEEMYYQGIAVDTFTLNVTDISVYEPGIDAPPSGPNIYNDAEWLLAHWYYFAIIAGVICLLAAISFRNTAIIMAGLVMLAAGGIGWYVAGDTSLLSWLSMVPPDLTAWLDKLR